MNLIRLRNRSKTNLIIAKRNGFECNQLEFELKSLRNEVVAKIRESKQNYMLSKYEESLPNQHLFWKEINGFLPTKRNIDKKVLPEEENELTADCLNEFFINEPLNIVSSLEEDNDIDLDFSNVNTITEEFELPSISESFVSQQIQDMKNSKAIGWDSIGVIMFKTFLNTFVPLITNIVNMSLNQGIVPMVWKTARVVALFKGGLSSDPNNFRPISVLPIASKVLERAVNFAFIEHLKRFSLLSSNQFGFRKNCSTTDALLAIQQQILKARNANKFVIIIVLDLKKAFDTVNHDILLQKLFRCGLSRHSMKWFTSYVRKRLQFLKLGPNISRILIVSIGIAQGSILGPLLFAIYINDITKIILFGVLYLYADDVTLVIEHENFEEALAQANADLLSINKWLSKNKLVVNKIKCKYMLICGKKSHPLDFGLKIGDHNLEKSKCLKILGVFFDESMTFSTHCDNVYKKLSKRVGFLFRIRQLVPKKFLPTLYNAIFFPVYSYASILWGFTYKTHIDPIVKIQKRSIRAVSFSKWNDHTLPIFKNLKIMNFNTHVYYESCKYIHKVLNHNCSGYGIDFFKYKISKYLTRSQENKCLEIPKNKSKLFQNSIFFAGVKIWNDLSLELKLIVKSKSFVKKLKTYFFDSMN
jgi:hypothetical protein